MTNGSWNASGNGTTRSGGTIGGGGVRATISTWGPLLVFNPIMEFFCELQHYYQGVRTKKLQNLQDF